MRGRSVGCTLSQDESAPVGQEAASAKAEYIVSPHLMCGETTFWIRGVRSGALEARSEG
jgi:hypothetical protein